MHDNQAQAEIFDFLVQYRRDRDAGTRRDLDDYLSRFPSHREAIMKEFRRLQLVESEPKLPKLWGPFQLIKWLGQGGQATVYEALDTRTDECVALKIFARLGSDEGTSRRWVHECRTLMRLDLGTSSFCRVLDFGNHDEQFYIAMELIRGETLATLIRGETTSTNNLFVPPRDLDSIDRIAALFEQIAEALSEAHRQGLLHRDVKPSNIMVDERRLPVILDFGLAKEMSVSDSSVSRELLGSISYMAPEQFQAEPLDERSDIYSLGVCLYETLTSQKPFEGLSPSATMALILRGMPKSTRDWNPEIPPAMDSLVNRMMAPSSEDRFRRMHEVANALRAYRKGEKLWRVRGEAFRHRLIKTWKKNRTKLVAGTFVLLVLCLGGLAYVNQSRGKDLEVVGAFHRYREAIQEGRVPLSEDRALIESILPKGDSRSRSILLQDPFSPEASKRFREYLDRDWRSSPESSLVHLLEPQGALSIENLRLRFSLGAPPKSPLSLSWTLESHLDGSSWSGELLVPEGQTDWTESMVWPKSAALGRYTLRLKREARVLAATELTLVAQSQLDQWVDTDSLGSGADLPKLIEAIRLNGRGAPLEAIRILGDLEREVTASSDADERARYWELCAWTYALLGDGSSVHDCFERWKKLRESVARN